MADIVSLAERSENGKNWSPEDALNDALKAISENDGAFNERCKKILIIAVDDQDPDGYNVGFIQAGMSMSECISAVEVMKQRFFRYMGY